MRPEDKKLTRDLTEKLYSFDAHVFALPGVNSRYSMRCFVVQLIDSIRRIKYIEVIRSRKVSEVYSDANNKFYDPLKAAIWHLQNNELDEACWQVFIFTHFGKNKRSAWSLPREVIKGNRSGQWTWEHICHDFEKFRSWLNTNQAVIKSAGSFGNHRKYQSLDAFSYTGTGNAIGSYIEWVGSSHRHQELFGRFAVDIGRDPMILFAYMYKEMNNVVSFGRTARFDYLTMLGKLGLVLITPDCTYLEDATGPKRGAKLLFSGSVNTSISNENLNLMVEFLEDYLDLFFGMQVLEDAMCNWQKSPEHYQYFGG